jgi:hypothetical protein
MSGEFNNRNLQQQVNGSTLTSAFLSHSIKLEMLWELMRLYDWRIITYQPQQDFLSG